MAKFELFLKDFFEGQLCSINKTTFEHYGKQNLIEICFYNGNVADCETLVHSIFLDKSTAIKFAKTLRTEINKITESEVNNV